MTVSEIASSDVVTADRDAAITDIVAMMADEEVGTVVITDGDEPVSIVSDRSIAMALSDTPDASDLRAEDVMTEDLVTVGEDATVFDAVGTMEDEAIRRVPVVDDGGRLAGLLSLDDVFVMMSEKSDQAARAIEKQAARL